MDAVASRGDANFLRLRFN